MLTRPSFAGLQGLNGRMERFLSEGLERLPDSRDVTRVASGSGDARPDINISPTPPVRLRKRQIEACVLAQSAALTSAGECHRPRGEHDTRASAINNEATCDSSAGERGEANNRNMAVQLCGTRAALYMLACVRACVRGNCCMNRDGHLCPTPPSYLICE